MTAGRRSPANRTLALRLLILTVAPWGILGLALASGEPTYASAAADQATGLDPSAVMILAALFLMLGLMVFYLFHLYGTGPLTGVTRALWLALIVFGTLFAMPFHWVLYVWRDHPRPGR